MEDELYLSGSKSSVEFRRYGVHENWHLLKDLYNVYGGILPTWRYE